MDGLTSSAILYKYTKEVLKYNNVHYKLHTGKQHGLSDDIIIEDDINLVILPDASSNEYDKHKKLRNRGIDVLVLDHHHADKYSENAIVINNQLSNNVKNKNLSGVGVVYKFLKALDDYIFEDKADYFLDLVSVGNVADMMYMGEPETRYLCYRGIKNINNLFIKALIEISKFELESKYNIDKIGWSISPKMNGTIRSGSIEEKEKMFQAFISDDYEFCLEVAEMCKKVKVRQDSGVKTALKNIEKNINLDKNDKCLMLEVSKTLKPNFTGLVAGKLASKYGVPTLLYREVKDGILGGSCRGNENISSDFKQDLINSSLMIFAEGHDNSFGHQLKKENIEELNQYLNNLYKDKEVIDGKTYEVDFTFDDNVNINVINQLAEYEDEWGNGINHPLIAFENLMINIEDENIKGTRSKNMIFEQDNVKFIKKFLSNDLKNKVLDQGFLFATVIGKVVNNIYNGQKYPQVEIVDIEIH